MNFQPSWKQEKHLNNAPGADAIPDWDTSHGGETDNTVSLVCGEKRLFQVQYKKKLGDNIHRGSYTSGHFI